MILEAALQELMLIFGPHDELENRNQKQMFSLALIGLTREIMELSLFLSDLMLSINVTWTNPIIVYQQQKIKPKFVEKARHLILKITSIDQPS